MTTEPSSAAMLREPRTRLGKLLMTSKVAGIGEIIAVLGVPVVAIGAVWLMPGENPGLQQLAVLFSILVMVSLAYVGLRLRGQRWDHFGLTFRLGAIRGIGRIILMSFPAFIAAAGLFLAAAYGYAFFAGGTEEAEATGLEFLSGNLPMLIATLGVVYVTASFSEEVIYRAFLMNRIAELGGSKRASWILAIVISSVAFGLAHYSWGLAGMVQTTFMGLALGVSYFVFGRRLWVVILAHGYMDTILLVQVYLSETVSATP